MLEQLFDEKNVIWIKIIKILSIVSFAVFVVLGLVDFVCVNILSDWLVPLWYSTEIFFERIRFCFWFLFAFVELSFSMATVNFLNNVQIIREKIELYDKKQNTM